MERIEIKIDLLRQVVRFSKRTDVLDEDKRIIFEGAWDKTMKREERTEMNDKISNKIYKITYIEEEKIPIFSVNEILKNKVKLLENSKGLKETTYIKEVYNNGELEKRIYERNTSEFYCNSNENYCIYHKSKSRVKPSFKEIMEGYANSKIKIENILITKKVYDAFEGKFKRWFGSLEDRLNFEKCEIV